MREYHKIQTLYLRDPENRHRTLLEGQFAKPEFEFLSDCEWVWTEKIDGTNIRVGWDEGELLFGGRTERAQVPMALLNHLMRVFGETGILGEVFDHGGVMLYGEGYGPKIQKGGGRYREDAGFILFDVTVAGMWLQRESVEDIAVKLGVPVVPVIGRGTPAECVECVRAGLKSEIAMDPTLVAEGVVLRPVVELLDRRGHRIISKLKHKDF